MSVGEMSVGEMSVGEVSVGEMSVGEMSGYRNQHMEVSHSNKVCLFFSFRLFILIDFGTN